MEWIERHRRGESVAVWGELIGRGETLSPAERADAALVARATMARVRDAVNAIVTALAGQGYVFARPTRAFVPPPADIGAVVDAIEGRVGAIPLSLRAAWEVAGSFDLTGSHPDWEAPACLRLPGAVEGPRGVWLTDPLVLYPAAEVYERVVDDDVPRGALPLWPDPLHKAGYSGDPETCVEVPAPSADASLVWPGDAPGAVTPSTLVGYLRWALVEYAGFPGFATLGRAAWPRIEALRALVVAP